MKQGANKRSSKSSSATAIHAFQVIETKTQFFLSPFATRNWPTVWDIY